MNSFIHCFRVLFFIFSFSLAQAERLPTPEEMSQLVPNPGTRQRVYDTLMPTVAELSQQAHRIYSHPETLADLEERLARVATSGEPENIFTPEEQDQLQRNLTELKGLESSFFHRWYLRGPMSGVIQLQEWLTRRNSPLPQGEELENLNQLYRQSIEENFLYSHWNENLPSEMFVQGGPRTWGELLLRFNEDPQFRQSWLRDVPQSLPFLSELAQIWAWEDSSVRTATLHNQNTPQQYWTLERHPREAVPNRFEKIMANDITGALNLEFAPSLFFNRVSRITATDGSVTFHIEAVEKGRTMELSPDHQNDRLSPQLFRGSSLLRTFKTDELAQRDYIDRGSLSLFLGPRTIQLNQIQEVMQLNPTLVLAVGQFGFSVTGGRAQAVSARTDKPEEILRKWTASLIDIIEFAKTTDVNAWVRQQTYYLNRALATGVGSGDSTPLPAQGQQNSDQLRNRSGQSLIMCRDLF